MEEQFDEATDFICIEQFYLPEDPGYVCFRCGDCCRLWVLLTYEEADRIAAYVKHPRTEFTIEYWDRSVSPEGCLVLSQKDNACVFLREKADAREKYCGIYELRPRICRDYAPSLMCKECQNALMKYWNLAATVTGRVDGSDERLKVFYDYLKKIAFGEV
jgi:Fe-S-cluster containining protein